MQLSRPEAEERARLAYLLFHGGLYKSYYLNIAKARERRPAERNDLRNDPLALLTTYNQLQLVANVNKAFGEAIRAEINTNLDSQLERLDPRIREATVNLSRRTTYFHNSLATANYSSFAMTHVQ
jgi:hypothetical protein